MEPLDRYFGIFDSEDRLVGGGGIEGNVMKCIALSEATRNESLTNPLVSRIRESALADGHQEIFIFTKPENRIIFESLAFHTVGMAEKAILMESDPRGIGSYCRNLSELAEKTMTNANERRGVIVMNCNPLTLGHLYLIENAAKRVDRLFIIPVKDSDTEYTYSERKSMMEKATCHLKNVTVVPGSPYSISRATFPTYFLKELSDASITHIGLDLDIFSRHIAPALGVCVRFIGTEPTDALTREYNTFIHRTLPQKGIEVEEIARLENNGDPVSASRVRKLSDNMQIGAAMRLLPESSIPYLLSHLATRCLREELDLTPKPGLVDRDDSGSHIDMDHTLMSHSIDALQPWFREICEIVRTHDHKNAETERQDLVTLIKTTGLAAEKAMLEATGGVNTHRGALFSFGLTLAAAMLLHKKHVSIDMASLSAQIQQLATDFKGGTDTNGARAKQKYGIKGAAEIAREGYLQLYSDWLPFWISVMTDKDGKHKLLLHIMSTLDDTNIYHRGGTEGAIYVKETAKRLLQNLNIQTLLQANYDFIGLNLSPGGAADMFALTLLTCSLLTGAET